MARFFVMNVNHVHGKYGAQQQHRLEDYQGIALFEIINP